MNSAQIETAAPPPMADTRPDAITFSRTIHRHLVHRAALCEVFLTDMSMLGGQEFLCGAQLPRQHAYFSDTICEPPIFDPVLLMEAVRQTAFVGAHEQFGVPVGHQFILPGISIQIDRPESLRRDLSPAEMTIFATVTNAKHRDGACTALDYEMRLDVGGEVVATAQTGMRMRTPDAYRQMRLEHRTGRPQTGAAAAPRLPVTPVRVGRSDQRNVVLADTAVSPGSVSASVLVPLEHPSMFDHPQDHIPGMVLVEAGRQLALLAASECCGLSPAKTFLARWSSKFTRFGELDVPATVTAIVGEPVLDDRARINVPVSLTFTQDLGPICEATAVVQTYPVLPPAGTGRVS